MRLHLGLIALMVVATTALAGGGTTIPRPGPNVRKLSQALSATRDLDAHFVQTRHSPLVDGEDRSDGTLLVQKPGHARLEYKSPSPLTVWKRGDSTWVYTPALKQVIVSPTGATGVPVGWVLGASIDDIKKEADLGEDGKGGVELRPHTSAGLPWSVVRIAFGKDGFPNRYEFTESSGESVVIELTSVRRNRGIPASKFRPAFPAGTNVVDTSK